MRIFEFTDYKAFIQQSVLQGGRGSYSRIAGHLGVHTSYVTQVFKGSKDLSLEQGFLLGDFLNLNREEALYLNLMIELARAVRPPYREYVKKRMSEFREAVNASGFQSQRQFDGASRTIFYSAWYYCAIHLMTTIPDGGGVEVISKRLTLSPSLVQGVLNFLVTTGLCDFENGRYTARVISTVLENEKQLSISHNCNWRQKGIEKIPNQKTDDLFFTSVVSMSQEDAEKIRGLLREAIRRIAPIVERSPATSVYCLNLDWFGIGS